MAVIFSEDIEWDVLVLGPEAYGQDLPSLIRRANEEHPAGFLIVIAPEDADAELNKACLAAGALEVIHGDPTTEELEVAIGRGATLINRYETRIREEKLQAISQLAVGVNHEINNPLMGLMGTAELILMENEDLSQKVREDLRNVIDQARRIQMITLRLRDLDHLRTVPYDDKEHMIDLVGEKEPEAEAAREPVSADDSMFEEPRILIVDDNQLIIDLIQRLLTDRFDIDQATRPSEAISKLQTNDYALVLLDLVMPEMDGLELFRAIRRFKPDQKIVITTAYDSDERIKLALGEGALDWIQKPFKFEKLEQMLWSALRSKRKAATNGS